MYCDLWPKEFKIEQQTCLLLTTLRCLICCNQKRIPTYMFWAFEILEASKCTIPCFQNLLKILLLFDFCIKKAFKCCYYLSFNTLICRSKIQYAFESLLKLFCQRQTGRNFIKKVLEGSNGTFAGFQDVKWPNLLNTNVIILFMIFLCI